MDSHSLFNYIWQYSLIFILFIILYYGNKAVGPETFTIIWSLWGKLFGLVLGIITFWAVQLLVFGLLIYYLIRKFTHVLAEVQA